MQTGVPSTQCTLPPTLTLDPEPGGITQVIVDSPCHATTVAELTYDGLSFGFALNRDGAGSVAAVGFQRASEAVLRFADGKKMGFSITFEDVERIERVAVLWAAPVDLELHAFEFGAPPESAGHVRPDRPRSFREVRRDGGGYLLDYRPVEGVGQSLSVYTYWRRHGERQGVVRLAVEFASRVGPSRPETCGRGPLAEPDFTVLKSAGGRIGRPELRRLAALDCEAIAKLPDRWIADAVDDLVVLQR